MPPFDDQDLPSAPSTAENISVLTWVLAGAALVLVFCTAVMFMRPAG